MILASLSALAISRDESASATYVLKDTEGDDKMTEEWIKFHRLQPSYNEFEFRNSQVCLECAIICLWNINK